MAQSIQSRLFTLMVRLMGLKKQMADPKRVQAIIAAARTRGPQPYVRSLKLKLQSQISESQQHGLTVYTLTPAGTTPATAIVYLCGGAYIFEASDFHWQWIDRLCQATGAALIVPMYPKIPHATAADAYAALEPLLQDVLVHYGSAAVQCMGDSAGGGLALGLVLRANARGQAQPARVVGFSPWVDVTMANPACAAAEATDNVLSRHGLVEYGRLWAGAEDPRAPHISPLYGDYVGMCPLVLYAGGRELFVPDIQLLCARAQAAGVAVTYREYAQMEHAFVIFPGAEAMQVIGEITA
ncbi:MAG: hypothetical protein RLZZ297_807 [Chloroflexota bacterium]|jgi:acetyl esterase/lipase